jgi:hypothetical protein
MIVICHGSFFPVDWFQTGLSQKVPWFASAQSSV